MSVFGVVEKKTEVEIVYGNCISTRRSRKKSIDDFVIQIRRDQSTGD